ncbi:MAG: TlpA family protein disulfide reductase, partial [Planctomycetaceae bacterium]|nr:TlpA family protein disulfide reductase [Planctomycetaceae bacterium]
QTMPLVEEALKTYNPEQVRLIAVNLEEPEEQIREVMERHELHATVALDVDGVTARRYQANAIPQLVIVDQDGNVAKLYVGGGPGTVAQMRESIDELLAPPVNDTPMQ